MPELDQERLNTEKAGRLQQDGDTTPLRETLHTMNFGIEPVLTEEEPVGFMRLQESIPNNLTQAADACDPYEPVETEVAAETRKITNTQTSIGLNNNQTFGPRESIGTITVQRIHEAANRASSADAEVIPIEILSGSIINENDLHPESKPIKLVGEVQRKLVGK